MPTRRATGWITLAATAMCSTLLVGCGSSVPGSTPSTAASGNSVIPVTAAPTGSAGALPPGFPEDVPRPEGFTLATGVRTVVDGSPSFTLVYSAADQTASVADYLATLKAAGFEINSEPSGDAANSGLGIWRLSDSSWEIDLAAANPNGTIDLTLNVTEVKN